MACVSGSGDYGSHRHTLLNNENFQQKISLMFTSSSGLIYSPERRYKITSKGEKNDGNEKT